MLYVLVIVCNVVWCHCRILRIILAAVIVIVCIVCSVFYVVWCKHYECILISSNKTFKYLHTFFSTFQLFLHYFLCFSFSFYFSRLLRLCLPCSRQRVTLRCEEDTAVKEIRFCCLAFVLEMEENNWNERIKLSRQQQSTTRNIFFFLISLKHFYFSLFF